MTCYQYPSPLIQGTFIKRYKRFFADVKLSDGEIVTAHCANSGSMMGLLEAGNPCLVRFVDDPKRKLKYTLEQIEVQGRNVGVNTHIPNHLAQIAIENDQIMQLRGYKKLRREVKYGNNSRIDILLSEHEDKPDCYVEVKSVTLCRSKDLAEFPDAVSARGTKHLNELIEMKKQGLRAVMLYLLQYQGLKEFCIAGDIDPAYNAAFKEALSFGVEAYAYGCEMSSVDIKVAQEIPINEYG